STGTPTSTRRAATKPATASTMASAPEGVATRCSATMVPAPSMTRPRHLVPPTSMPMLSGASGTGTRSVSQQRSDPPAHVQVGVADAHGELAGLRQRLLDGVLHHVVAAVHGGGAARADPSLGSQ